MKKKLAFFILNCLLLVLSLPRRLRGRHTDFDQLTPRKILMIRLDYIGDVVMASPAFSYLRSRFPNSSISLLTNSISRELYKNDENLDKIWVYNWPWRLLRKDNGFSKAKIKELFHLIRALRKENIDLVIDSRGDSRFVFLFGTLVGARIKIGNSRSGNSGLFDFASTYDVDKHEVERSFDVLGCFGGGQVKPQPYIPLSVEALENAKKLLEPSSGAPVALVAPYSSKDVKSWPADYFKDVIQYLVNNKYQVYVVGAKDDSESAAALISSFSSSVYSLAGKTSILELAALTSISQLVVGVDTGVLHIASCFQTPIVAIFGPTRSCEYRPYSNLSTVVDNGTCQCDQLTHAKCDVPLYGYAKCMSELTPEAVIEAIKKI